MTVSMNMTARLNAVKWVVSGGLLLGMALSPRLWVADRPFPTIPVLAALPELPHEMTIGLVALFVASLIAMAIHSRPGLLIAATLATSVTLALFDLNRLQPWFYFYLLLLCGLFTVDWHAPKPQRMRAGVAVCGFVVAATYLWSGLQKANATFAADVIPWLLEPLGGLWVERLRAFWFLAPITEVAIGVMLFIPRTRRWALVLAGFMHLCILLAIGPLGRDFNSVIWPWNIAAPILAFIVFYRNDGSTLHAAWSAHGVGKLVVLLAGVLPALNFVGLWDTALSASLYSGRSTDAWVYLTPDGVRRLTLPETIRKEALREDAPGRFRLDVGRWAEAALNVPPYGEPRVYGRIMRQLEQSGIPRQQMTLILREQPRIGDRSHTYSAMKAW